MHTFYEFDHFTYVPDPETLQIAKTEVCEHINTHISQSGTIKLLQSCLISSRKNNLHDKGIRLCELANFCQQLALHIDVYVNAHRHMEASRYNQCIAQSATLFDISTKFYEIAQGVPSNGLQAEQSTAMQTQKIKPQELKPQELKPKEKQSVNDLSHINTLTEIALQNIPSPPRSPSPRPIIPFPPRMQLHIWFIDNLKANLSLSWVEEWSKETVSFEQLNSLISFLQQFPHTYFLHPRLQKEIDLFLNNFQRIPDWLLEERRTPSQMLFVAWKLVEIEMKIRERESLDSLKACFHALGSALPKRKLTSCERGLDLFHRRLSEELGKPQNERDILFIENSVDVLSLLEDFELFTLLSSSCLTDEEILRAFEIMASNTEDVSAEFSDEEFRCIVLRFLQIAKADKKISALLPREILKIACYVEKKLPALLEFSKEFFKKTDTHLSRTMQINPTNADVYLLSKGKTEVFYESGTYKKVTSGLQLPHNPQEEVMYIAQAVNHTRYEKQYATQEHIRDIRKEIEVHRRFSKKRGIWPLLSVCEYTKLVKSSNETVEVPKISIITPLASGTLLHIYKREFPEAISLHQLLVIFQDILYGICTMHKSGFIHGDLKATNALFSMSAEGFVMGGLIDFGFSFEVGEKLPYPFNKGYYGSVAPTPFEMLVQRPFQGDLFKVEVWALGTLLFSLFTKAAPPWFSLTSEYETMPEELDETRLHEIKAKIDDAIEKPIKAYLAHPPRRIAEQILYLIYSMMRLDPKDRFTAQEALDVLEAILNVHPPTVINRQREWQWESKKK